jgi:hypothetical protein
VQRLVLLRLVLLRLVLETLAEEVTCNSSSRRACRRVAVAG